MKLEKIKSEAIIAEFIGTFSLSLAILVTVHGLAGDNHVATIAALTITLFVLLVGKTSGAHLNPAITIALNTIKKIDFVNTIAFIVSQLAGALLALVVLSLFYDGVVYELITDASNKVFWAEFLGAAVFAFGFSAAIFHKLTLMESSVAIGISYYIGIIIASIASFGIINPAVALVLGVASWPYILGPFLGAVFGANLYRLLEPIEDQVARRKHKAAHKVSKSKKKSK